MDVIEDRKVWRLNLELVPLQPSRKSEQWRKKKNNGSNGSKLYRVRARQGNFPKRDLVLWTVRERRDYVGMQGGSSFAIVIVAAIVIAITFYSPANCLGQKAAKGHFGIWFKLPPANICQPFTMEASHCLFYCWTSNRKAVKTNFYGLFWKWLQELLGLELKESLRSELCPEKLGLVGTQLNGNKIVFYICIIKRGILCQLAIVTAFYWLAKRKLQWSFNKDCLQAIWPHISQPWLWIPQPTLQREY